jgi:hypothetical protein
LGEAGGLPPFEKIEANIPTEDYMAKVTWLGEDATPDLKETKRFGIVFEKGKVVEVEQGNVVLKLSANPNFKVEGKAEEREDLLHIPPSQQSAQGPVPKPGEPIVPETAKPEAPVVNPLPKPLLNKVPPFKKV